MNYTELNARNVVNSYSIDTFILKFLHYPLKYYEDLVVKGTIHCLFPIKKSEMDRHFMSNDTYLSNNYYMSNIPKGVNNVTYKDD